MNTDRLLVLEIRSRFKAAAEIQPPNALTDCPRCEERVPVGKVHACCGGAPAVCYALGQWQKLDNLQDAQ